MTQDQPQILLWKYEPLSNRLRNLFSKAIVWFTRSPYTHVAIYWMGAVWESTQWEDEEGKKHLSCVVTEGRHGRGEHPPAEVYQLGLRMSELQLGQLEEYLRSTTIERQPYNLLRGLCMAFVWPTRWFWRWINWTPFKADCFGEFCSSYVDEAFKRAGVDLFPERLEEITIPGMFPNSPRLVIVRA